MTYLIDIRILLERTRKIKIRRPVPEYSKWSLATHLLIMKQLKISLFMIFLPAGIIPKSSLN